MSDIYVKKCPSCGAGENIFHGMGEGETPYAVLFSGKQQDGEIVPNMNKRLVVQPVICSNCGLVLLFNPSRL